MSKPKIAATRPVPVELEADTQYWFCTCGRSRDQPFCDGSHQGSELAPLPFRVEQDDRYFLCQCKRSAKQPYCDGSHKRITQEELDAQQGLRSVWHKVAEPGEMQEGEVRAVQAGSRRVALTFHQNHYGALDAACPHQGGPLAEGSIECDGNRECWLRCPWHGWDFHPLTGKSRARQDEGVPTYPAEERDDGIYVEVRESSVRTRTVSDLMVETLVNWGVTTVFGMVGHSNLGLADAVRGQTEKGKLAYYGIRHEGAAAFACSGFAKLSGRPAACMTIAGPGATNLLTGLWDAKVDRAPILALTGQVNTQVFGPGAFQEIDLAAAFHAVAGFSHTVLPGSRHAELMTLALKHANVERDVAHLIFPDEVQVIPAPKQAEASAPAGRTGRSDIAPAEKSLDQALELVAKARRPVVITGYGARERMTPVVQLAERLNAPVLTTFKAKGQLPDDHPLAAGVLGRSGTPVASSLMNQADLLIVFGASFSNHTGITPTKPIIQVDFEAAALGRFHPVEVPVWGEIGVAAERLLERLPPGPDRVDQRPEIAERQRLWAEEKTRRAGRDRGLGLSSASIFAALSRQCPDNAVISVDVGNNTYSFGRYFECRRQTILMSGYLGSIGFGFPAAMGAWAATQSVPEHRDRPVLSISGDGGFGQYLGEFTTAVKYGMNITHVLLNNQELGKISKEQRDGHWKVWQTSLHNPDFAEFARSCGGFGVRVSEARDLDRALKDAITHPGPALVELLSDTELV
jgi:thiamine pyrophosphate-dependent acetolactate synthase large subunit-like protein/CDGSH-type Zn-finger protein/nitrite reductase/ring-hydroxylating ferredoxin subunit